MLLWRITRTSTTSLLHFMPNLNATTLRDREVVERTRERRQERTRKTTFPELLDACHNYLYSGLTVQTDATKSTRGDAANANNKLRPERILPWEDFLEKLAAVWADIMESDFVEERHFTSLHTLAENGEVVQHQMVSSELDLNIFQQFSVEDSVGSIAEQLYKNRELRRRFRLRLDHNLR
ncbi:hypothetical protein N0V90_012841 [Kalmusia sp. IMI 367209]|nr:hypothetical protein N0V90_012841 [Kalmusia sp. IMI 367209]